MTSADARRTPRLTVIIPVYNGEQFLPEAIASVGAQGYPEVELIVVDDGSTDSSPAIIDRLGDRARVIRQENAGPAAARNRAMEIATGELISFIDVDDLWPEGKLELQVGFLHDHPEIDAVLGRIKYVTMAGAKMPPIRFEDDELKTISNVHLGSGVFRRRAFDVVGGFDEDFRFGEDVDWFLRARETGLAFRVLPDVTLLYRLHRSNMTLERTPQEVVNTRVLKKSLDRRRAMEQLVDIGRWRDHDDAHSS
jgi:glycosyltransferase involved in cell wall biosynthesis